MKRLTLNAIALGIIFTGAPAALSPHLDFMVSDAFASVDEGGTCCQQSGATCYLQVGDNLIIQDGAHYSSGACPGA